VTPVAMCMREGVIWLYACERGLGLSPSPVRAQTLTHANFNIYETINITRNKTWCIGREDFVKALTGGGGPGFESHGLHKILN
jgi:hypothetical protein